MDNPSDPKHKRVHLEGVELSYFERGTRQRARPTLLFVHATGFHGRVWDRIIEPFQDHYTIALELRGHGRSSKQSVSHWAEIGRDMAAFVEALDLREVIGIGHSVGAHAMVDAAAATGEFARLLLLDPTIVEPQAYGGPLPFELDERGHPAGRRRSQFDSPEAMFELLRDKGSYALFDERMFRDYCKFGLLKAGDNTMELACPPQIEASVYLAARTNGGVHASLAQLEIPVTVVRGKRPPAVRPPMDFASSPTWPGLVTQLTNGRELHLPDCTHFIPMQRPQYVIDQIQGEIDAWSVSLRNR